MNFTRLSDTQLEKLRSNGLPHLISLRQWHRNLLERMSPLLLVIALCNVILTIAIILLAGANDLSHLDEASFMAILLAALGVAIVVPAISGILFYKRLQAMRSKTNRRSIALGIHVLFWVAGIATSLISQDMSLGSSIVTFFALYTAVALFCWSGLSAIAHWATRMSLQQFSAVAITAGKTLPIGLPLFIFALFSQEIWQIVDKLSGARLLTFIAAVCVIAFITTLSAARAELRDVNLFSNTAKKNRIQTLLATINIYSLIVIAQLIQAILFTVIFGFVMLVLCKIAVRPELMATWLSHPAELVTVFKINLPIQTSLLYATGFVTAFATLGFLVSAATDEAYRSRLFDPLIASIKKTLLEK